MKIKLPIPNISLYIIFVAVLSILIISQAGATEFAIPMDYEYSQGTEPAASSPWAAATFVYKSPNTVTLSLSAVNLVGSEFISVWLFNFDPILDPDLLSFTAVSTTDAGPTSINTGADSFKAGPSKYYDIEFSFPSSNGRSSNRFTGGESLMYDITYTGDGTFNEYSFNFENSSDGIDTRYHSAMHVQSIDPGGKSGWVGNTNVAIVPEPVSSILFLSGCAVFGIRRYQKKR
ncbi:MAG: hypothetical protein AB1499_03190 [Nitrospirota bacterium]